MAAETVVIDIMTNFKDNAGNGFEREKKSLDDYEKSLEKLKKQVEKLSADKAMVKIDTEDKATSKLNKIQSFLRGLKDKAVSFPIKAIDKATAPIRFIKKNLFSLKTLIAGIASGVAIKKTILDPIGLADSYSGAKIGFSTKLGDASGQKLMDQLDKFAKDTPFKTENTIGQAQKMIAMGWDAKNIVKDMTTIGDAAAATGKGDEGLQRIVLALSQIKSKGKLSTEELNQLAEAGISAKRYLAEGLGYGSGDAGVMKLSDDLQKGAIGSEKAIQAIMSGMKEYQGMMDKTANETVEGLKSQIEDTFEINIFRRWGQGLQDGAKKGLGSVVALLDKSDGGLKKVGDQLEEIGSEMSNLAAEKLENSINKIMKLSDSREFQNADLFGKAHILWDKVIAEPFSDWWDTKGHDYFLDKIGNAGEGLGSGLSNTIEDILGLNNDVNGVADKATTMGGRFAEGFVKGFDFSGVGDKVTECLSNSIKKTLNILSGEGKGSDYLSAAMLGYLGLKVGGTVFGGANSVLGLLGKKSLGSMLLGSANAGTGVLGMGTSAAIGMGAGNLGLNGSLSAGALASLGLGSVAMGAVGAGTFIGGVTDLYKGSQKKDKAGQAAYGKSAGKKIFGAGMGALAGAAVGSVVPVIGTAAGALIGAGVGGAAGWISGKKDVDSYKKSVENADKALRKATSKDLENHFGRISLSMKEVETLSNKIAGGSSGQLKKFSEATQTADSSLQNLESTYSEMEKANWKMEKLNWKTGLGLKVTPEEKEGYKEAVDDYVSSAKQYVEDKQYEFETSVSLLMNVKEGSAGADILSGGNAVYGNLQKDLDSLNGKLKKKIDIALEDGNIDVDEQAIISKYQEKIKAITDKISGAESDAKMEALKIKFGGADLDYDSFSSLQEQLGSIVKNKTASYDDALEVDIANLKLQSPDGGEEYDKALKELTDSYHAKINDLQVEVEDFQLDTLVDSYGEELNKAFADSDLVKTTQAKIKEAMETAYSEGVDVKSWDAETCKKYLGLDGLKDSSLEAITEITSSIAQTLPEQLNASLASTDVANASDAVKGMIERSFGDMTIALPTTGIPEQIDSSLASQMTTDKFSGTGSKAVSSASAAIKSSFSGSSVDASIGVRLTPHISLTKTSATITASGGATGSGTANLSVSTNAAGGYIGDKQLSWLAEEGYGEYVIPTDPKRRGRALSLWEQAGETLGVKKHAAGGITGSMLPSSSNSDSSITSGSHKDGNIEINVGGITIQLGNGNDNGNIISQLSGNKKQITSMISEFLSEALEEAFESLPLSAD